MVEYHGGATQGWFTSATQTQAQGSTRNQDDDLSMNCVRDSILHSSNLSPNFPTLPKMRGFKIASLNICSLLAIMTNCVFSWKIKQLTYLD